MGERWGSRERGEGARTSAGETSFPCEQGGERTFRMARENPGGETWEVNSVRGSSREQNSTEPRFLVWIPAQRSFGWEWKRGLWGRAKLGTSPKLPICQARRGTWSSSLLSTWLMSKLLAGSGKGAPVIYLIPTKLPPWALHTFFEPGLCWAALGGRDSWEKFFFFNSDIFWRGGYSCPLTDVAIKTKLEVAS